MKNIKWLIFLIDLVAFVLISFNQANFWLLVACLIWGNILIYSLLDINNRSSLFTFLISFFVFLMGRQILENFFGHEVRVYFDTQLNLHAELSLAISLFFLSIGYFMGKYFLINRKYGSDDSINYNSIKYLSIRTASKLIYYITYIPLMATIIDIALFVSGNGYLDYYTSYSPHIPYLAQKIGDMSPVSFYVFLATMPSKKECKTPMVFYAIYLILTLATGKRFTFVVGFLILFVYLIVRNQVNRGEAAWFGLKQSITYAVAVPIVIIVLYTINDIRFGNTSATTFGVIDKIQEFFYSQGVSINVVKQGVLYANELPPGKVYSFGTLINFFRANFISSFIGVQSFSGNTVEHAIYGNSFAHAISYIVFKSAYLSGSGLGSSYIAEVFHDGGYFGIALINIIYGVVLAKLYNFKKKGIWLSALSIIVLRSLLFAPRGSADAFVADFIDITTYGTFLIIYIFSKFLERFSMKSCNKIQNS